MHPQPTEDSGLLFAVGILYFLLGFAISTSWVMDILYSARRFTIDISKTCGGKVTLSFNPLGASQFFLILNCFGIILPNTILRQGLSPGFFTARCVAVYVRPDDRPDKFGVVVIDLFERIPALFIVTASSLLVFAWGYVITTCVWDAERWRKGFAISTLLFNLIVYSVYSVALAVDHDGISTAVPGSAALVLWYHSTRELSMILSERFFIKQECFSLYRDGTDRKACQGKALYRHRRTHEEKADRLGTSDMHRCVSDLLRDDGGDGGVVGSLPRQPSCIGQSACRF